MQLRHRLLPQRHHIPPAHDRIVEPRGPRQALGSHGLPRARAAVEEEVPEGRAPLARQGGGGGDALYAGVEPLLQDDVLESRLGGHGAGPPAGEECLGRLPHQAGGARPPGEELGEHPHGLAREEVEEEERARDGHPAGLQARGGRHLARPVPEEGQHGQGGVDDGLALLGPLHGRGLLRLLNLEVLGGPGLPDPLLRLRLCLKAVRLPLQIGTLHIRLPLELRSLLLVASFQRGLRGLGGPELLLLLELRRHLACVPLRVGLRLGCELRCEPLHRGRCLRGGPLLVGGELLVEALLLRLGGEVQARLLPFLPHVLHVLLQLAGRARTRLLQRAVAVRGQARLLVHSLESQLVLVGGQVEGARQLHRALPPEELHYVQVRAVLAGPAHPHPARVKVAGVVTDREGSHGDGHVADSGGVHGQLHLW
mmetsp:Transcript_18092/g.58538  ORF Transcript_18092/g.58538 Transcript_18092/m.58538 type:complete len:425 (+) Transcript_18092:371-1645(+)